MYRKIPAVAQPTVTTDFNQSFDIELYFPAQVTFNLEFLGDEITQECNFRIGQILDPRVRTHTSSQPGFHVNAANRCHKYMSVQLQPAYCAVDLHLRYVPYLPIPVAAYALGYHKLRYNTPLRLTILQFAQRFFIDAVTFIIPYSLSNRTESNPMTFSGSACFCTAEVLIILVSK